MIEFHRVNIILQKVNMGSKTNFNSFLKIPSNLNSKSGQLQLIYLQEEERKMNKIEKPQMQLMTIKN